MTSLVLQRMNIHTHRHTRVRPVRRVCACVTCTPPALSVHPGAPVWSSPVPSLIAATHLCCLSTFPPLYLIKLTMWCYLHADFTEPEPASPRPPHPTPTPPFLSQFSDKQEMRDQSNVIAQQPANAICLKDQVFAIHLPLNSCPHHFSCFYSCYFLLSSLPSLSPLIYPWCVYKVVL